MPLPYRSLLAQCVETALIDEQSKSLSLINIIEEVAVPAFPVVLAKAAFVFSFGLEVGGARPAAARVDVRWLGEVVVSIDVPANFSEGPRGRVLMYLGGLSLAAPGSIEATLFLDGELFETVAVPVKQQAPVLTVQPVPPSATG